MHETDSVTFDDIQYASYGRPCFGELVSGDVAVLRTSQDHVFIAMVDVLGHGKDAYALAVDIRAYLESAWQADVLTTLLQLHEHIGGSIGAAASLAVLNTASGELRHVGVGNTVMRKFGRHPARLTPTAGIVGGHMRRPREQRTRFGHGDVLIGYSDGVSDHFELDDYRQLTYESPHTVVRRIVDRFGKQFDDATCLAVRYGA